MPFLQSNQQRQSIEGIMFSLCRVWWGSVNCTNAINVFRFQSFCRQQSWVVGKNHAFNAYQHCGLHTLKRNVDHRHHLMAVFPSKRGSATSPMRFLPARVPERTFGYYQNNAFYGPGQRTEGNTKHRANQCAGFLLSSFTTGLLTEGALFKPALRR